MVNKPSYEDLERRVKELESAGSESKDEISTLRQITLFSNSLIYRLKKLDHEKNLYDLIFNEMANSKIEGTIFKYEPENEQFRLIKTLTLLPKKNLDKIESETGYSLTKFNIPIKKSEYYSRIAQGEVLQVGKAELTKEVLPKGLGFLSKILGFDSKSKSAVLPIKKKGNVIGAVAFDAPQTDFIPYIENLSSSIEDTLNNIETNKQLKESEKKYRTTMDNLLTGVVVHSYDTSIIFTNSEAHKIIGLNENQLKGKQVIDPAWNFVYEDKTQMKIEDYPVNKIIASKKPLYDYVLGIKKPDLKELTWVVVNGMPQMSSENTIETVVINFVDITERKKTDEALKKSEYFFSQLFEQSIVSTQLLDMEGNTLRVNSPFCELFGVTTKDMINYKIFEDDAIKKSDAYEPLMDVFKNKNSHRWRNKFDIAYASESSGVRTSKPETIYLDNLSYPILDNEGDLQYVVIQHHDITKRKKAEDELKNLLHEKEILLQEVHHRVKNNLQIISSLASMQYGKLDNDFIKREVLKLHNRIDSIALVHELLYKSDNYTVIPFKDYVESLTDKLYDAYNFDRTQININYSHLTDTSLDINTAIPLGLITNEILTNTFKYAFPNSYQPTDAPEIGISFFTSDNVCYYSITDNGVGFPSDFNSKKLNTLGFSLVEGLVNQIDGTIEFSHEKYKGSRFKITFPKKYGGGSYRKITT